MECEPADDLLIYTSGAPADPELSWSLGYLSLPFDGGSGSSTDFQDTADNAETRPPAPADNAAAAAAADAVPHATSLVAGSLVAAPVQQPDGPLPSSFSIGIGPPPQPAALIADTVAPACLSPQPAATAAAQPRAAGSSPPGSASPPAVRTAQPAEQQVADASARGAANSASPSAAASGTVSGRGHIGRKRSEPPAEEHDDETGQEQQQSGGRLNTRDKQNERKRDQIRQAHIREEVERLWTRGKQQDAAAGAAQLDYASRKYNQQLPPASLQAAGVVPPSPAAACCIEGIRSALAAALAAAGLAPEPMLQSSAVDWQQIRKAWAHCMQRLMDSSAPGASESLTSLMGAVQQVLDILWDAQPTLWRAMLCTGHVLAPTARVIGQKLARLELPKTTKRTFLTTALRQRDAVTDQATYWLQRTNVLEDLQAAAAAGVDVSDRSCVMLLHAGCKAAELAASMRVMAVQTMEADRKLLHTVCFDRDAPDALSDYQAATIMVGMLNIGVDMATVCRMLQA